MTQYKFTFLAISVFLILLGSCMYAMWRTYSAYPAKDDMAYCVEKLLWQRKLHVQRVKTSQKTSSRLPSSLSVKLVYGIKNCLSKPRTLSLSEKLLYIESWVYSGNDKDVTVECLVTCGRVCDVSITIGENRESYDACRFINMVNNTSIP